MTSVSSFPPFLCLAQFFPTLGLHEALLPRSTVISPQSLGPFKLHRTNPDGTLAEECKRQMEYGILQSRGGSPGGVTVAMAKGTIAEGSVLTGQDLTMARESIVPCAVASGKNGQWPKRPLCQLTCFSRLLPLSQSSGNRQCSWGVFPV